MKSHAIFPQIMLLCVRFCFVCCRSALFLFREDEGVVPIDGHEVGCHDAPDDRLTEDDRIVPKLRDEQHDKDDLVRAFAIIAERSERRLPPPVGNFRGIVGVEPYPVTKKAAQVLKRLLMRGVAKFRSLFSGARSRSEIVATFLAVLELCRLRSIALEGDDEDVTVRFCKMPEGEMEDTDGSNGT